MSVTTPGPTGLDTLRLARQFQQDPIPALRDLADRYGKVVKFNLGGQATFLMSGTETAAHVLVSRQENYARANYPSIDDMIGSAMFTTTGDTWFHSRSLAQPIFAARRLPQYANRLAEVAARLGDEWASKPMPHTVDMVAAMRRLALEAVSRALFGGDTDEHLSSIVSAIEVFEKATGEVLRSPIVLVLNQMPGVGPQRAWRMQFRRRAGVLRAAKEFDRVAYQILARRERDGHGTDLVGQMLDARDETTGEGLSHRQIRDEATGFLLAAQDSTGLTMAWTWYLLATHPDVREKLEAEVAEVLGDREPTAADADRMPWTRAVISEALRMYPVVWALDRNVLADDEVLGHRIPGGSRVLVCPPVNHWDTTWWPDPDRFDPSRFLPGHDGGRPRTAFLPFGGGRRICIGQGFAMLEMVLAAATLARRFRLDLPPGATVDTHVGVFIAPKGGLPMTVTPR